VLMTRPAVCVLCIGMVLSPVLAQQTNPETKPPEPASMNVVYFLDPSDQTLRPLPKDTAKVVTKRGFASAKGFIQIPGATSLLRLKSGHDLEFVIKCADPDKYELFPFTTGKDKREAMVSAAKAKFFGGVTTERKVGATVAVSKVGDMVYRFVVTAPEPGEYGFAVGWSVYGFGVDAK